MITNRYAHWNPLEFANDAERRGREAPPGDTQDFFFALAASIRAEARRANTLVLELLRLKETRLPIYSGD